MLEGRNTDGCPLKTKAYAQHACFLAFMLFVVPEARALHQTPGVIEIGDRLGFLVPFGNSSTNTVSFSNVSVVVDSAPAWLTLQNTSDLGPVTLWPGLSKSFRLDFQVNSNYSSSQSTGEIIAELTTDTTGLNAPRFVWHIRTENGFLTYEAECLDEAGNSFGGFLAPDRTPPLTSIFFTGQSYSDSGGHVYVSTDSGVGFDGVDQYMPDAVTSDVAFTGYLIDQAAQNISQLSIFQSTFSLSAGTHTLVFASSDNASNVETLETMTLLVDSAPPITQIQVTGSSSTSSNGDLIVTTNAAIGFTAVDPASSGVVSGVASIQFNVDGSSFSIFPGTFTLGEGFHSIGFFSVDNVGNTESTHTFNAFFGPTLHYWTGSFKVKDSLGGFRVAGSTTDVLNPEARVQANGVGLRVGTSPLAVSSATVLLLRFDEGSGNSASDASGLNSSATLTNVSWAAGRLGSAGSFNGSNSTASVPDNSVLDSTGPLTIEVWVYYNTFTGAYQTAITKAAGWDSDPANTGYKFPLINNYNELKFFLDLNGSWNELNAGVVVSSQAWTHLAATYDGSQMRVYKNGIKIAQQSASGAVTTSTNPLTIGFQAGRGDYVNGLIDEVRILNRALSADEVASDFNSGAVRFSNGGIAGPWTYIVDPTSAHLTGISGSTALETDTATVSLIHGADNRVVFLIQDQSGNLAASDAYFIGADTSPPAAVDNLFASSGTLAGAAILTFAAPSESPAPLLGRYAIQASTDPSALFSSGTAHIVISTAGATVGSAQSLSLPLDPNTTYYFKLWTQDSGLNWSPISNGATAMTLAQPPIPRITNVFVTSATISWIALPSSPTAASAAGFRLEASPNAAFDYPIYSSSTVGTSISALTVSGLRSGDTYYFRLASLNSRGAPNYASSGSTLTISDPNPPSYTANSFRISTSTGGFLTTASTTNVLNPQAQIMLLDTYSGLRVGQSPLAVSSSTVLLLRFDEGSGSAAYDAAGLNSSAALTNVSWAAGKFGSAGSFNGSTSQGLIPSSPALQLSGPLTIELWVYYNTFTGAYQTAVTNAVGSYNGPTDSGYLFPLIDNYNQLGFRLHVNGAWQWLVAGVVVSSQAWTHLAATYDGAYMRVYKNGLLIAQQAASGAVTTNSNPISIGYHSGAGDYVNGLLDEVRVLNRALSADEIASDFNSGAVRVSKSGTGGPWTYVLASTQTGLTGATGTTAVQTATAAVSLAHGADNRVVFLTQDLSGNLAVSDAFFVGADTSPPAAVTNLVASAVSPAGTVSLGFSAPADSPAPLSGSYSIEYSTDPAVAFSTALAQVLVSTLGVTAGTAQGINVSLSPNTTYYLALWTRDQGLNWSPISNGATAMALSLPVSSAQLKGVFYSSATVTWPPLPASPSSSSASGYILQACRASDFSSTIVSSSTNQIALSTLSVQGLLAGATYFFRVGSLNALGQANYVGASSGVVIVNSTPPSYSAGSFRVTDSTGGFRLAGSTTNVLSPQVQVSVQDAAGLRVGQSPLAVSSSTVLLLRFDEGSGSAAYDATGLDSSAVLTNVSWATGKFGWAGSFNGSTSQGSISSSTALQLSGPLSIELWVYYNTFTGAYQTAVTNAVGSYNGATDTGFWFPLINNYNELKFFLHLNGAWAELNAGVVVSSQAWTHLSATYDGSQMRIYKNGLLIAQRSASGTVTTNSNPISIGYHAGAGDYLNGLLDEVRILNRGLSPDEVASDYNSGAVRVSNSGTNGPWTYVLASTQTGFSGTTGTTSVQTATATVSLAQGADNRVVFLTQDLSGNLGVSDAFFVGADTSPPAAVTNLVASAASPAGTISLGFSAPADSPAPLSGSYSVEYSTDPAVAFSTASAQVLVSTLGVTAGTAQGINLVLSPNTTYYLALWTRDQGLNWSPISNGATVLTLTEAPELPSGIPISNVDATGFTVSWSSGDAVGGYNPAWTLYVAEISTSSDFSLLTTSSSTFNAQASFSGLSTGSTQYARVKAIGASGISTPYTFLASNDQIAPSSPTAASARWSGQAGASIQWSAPGNDGALGNLTLGSEFRIQWSTQTPGQVSWSTSAAQVVIGTGPVSQGSPVGTWIGGLPTASTVSFTIWSRDAGWNYSPPSDIVSTYVGSGMGPQSFKFSAVQEFHLGAVYAFPNPSRPGKRPTIHVETGLADRLEIRIYDVAGDLRHQVTLTGPPGLIDDGHGPQYAYEYRWEASGAGSGVYIYVVEAYKSGLPPLKAVKKLAIIK